MAPSTAQPQSPIELDLLLVRHLTDNGGVSSRSALRSLGLSGSSIDRRISSGLLVTFGRGAIALAGLSDRASTLRRAALIQRPDAVLARETAADLHRFPLGTAEPGAVVLLTAAEQSGRAAVGRVVRTKHLPPDDITVVEGMRVTTAERTYLDLADELGYGRMRWMGEQLLLDRKLSPGALAATAHSLARRGRNGTRRRRLLLSVLLAEDPAHQSIAERAFSQLCVRHGIRTLRAQFVPPWYDGRRAVVDFADPVRRKIVEIDGRRWHSTAQDRTSDRQRDRAATNHGWSVIRFGYDEIVQRPTVVIEDLRAFLGPTECQAA